MIKILAIVAVPCFYMATALRLYTADGYSPLSIMGGELARIGQAEMSRVGTSLGNQLLPPELRVHPTPPPGDAFNLNGNRTHSFDTGVNVTFVNHVQDEMTKRDKQLSQVALELKKGLEEVEGADSMNFAKGLTTTTEIVDPEEIAKEAEVTENLEKSKMPQLGGKKGKIVMTGKLTAPIIILEPTPDDNLEKIQINKLLSCGGDENTTEEDKEED